MRIRLRTVVGLCLLLGVLGATREALAQGVRLRLERVDVEPSYFPGMARVRLYVVATNPQGASVKVTGEGAWQAVIGTVRDAPYVAGRFAAVRREQVQIALVLETSNDYAKDFDNIKQAAGELLESLPSDYQVWVVGYGDEIDLTSKKLLSPKQAMKYLDGLEADTGPGGFQLLPALKKVIGQFSIATFNPPNPDLPVRRILVLVSDGIDEALDSQDYDAYRKIAKTAAMKGFRILGLGWAPRDDKWSLQGVGELVKQTGGTFRWLHDPSGFSSFFGTVKDEIREQYVLTLFVPIDAVTAGARVVVKQRDFESNDLRAPAPTCGGKTCAVGEYCADGVCARRSHDAGTGILGWIVYVIIGGVVLLAGLLAFAWIIHLKHVRQAKEAEAAAHGEAPAAAPSHRIAPQMAPGMGPPPAPGWQGQAPGTGAHAAAPSVPPPPARGAVAPASGAYRGAVASLLVLAGARQGSRLPLRHGFLMGKAPGCDLILDNDSYASGRHAMILMDERGGCTVVDQSSTNGTFVNGVRTSSQKLMHGMVIRVGSTEVRFLAQ